MGEGREAGYLISASKYLQHFSWWVWSDPIFCSSSLHIQFSNGLGRLALLLDDRANRVPVDPQLPGYLPQGRIYPEKKIEIRHPVDDPTELFLYDNDIRTGKLKRLDKAENADTFRPKKVNTPICFAHGRVNS